MNFRTFESHSISKRRNSWAAILSVLLIAGIWAGRADPLDTWLPVRQSLTQVVFGGGRFVAISYEGTIITSTNGVNWTTSSESDAEQDFGAVAYVNQQFLSDGPRVIASKDGIAWAPAPFQRALSIDFQSLTYGNGQYVAGLSGGGVAQSPDGIHWTERLPNPSSGERLSGSAYGGGRFVFVGGGGRIVTSDGVSWAEQTSGITSYLIGVAYGNGRFVAAGVDGTIYTSPDGIQWAQKWAANGTYLARVIRSITYGNGRFVAVGDFGLVLSSPDGIIWTQRAGFPDIEHRGFKQGPDLQKVAYGNGIFVAVGGYGAIFTSNDGDYWNELFPASDLSSFVQDLAYGRGEFMMVEADISGAGAIATSENGLNWSERIAGKGMGGQAVAFGNGRFTVAGSNNRASFDFGDWLGWDQSLGGAGVSAIAFGNGLFVAVGFEGSSFTSTDGKNWASHDIGTTNWVGAVAYGKGRYVAVGENTTLLTSTNGEHWIPGSAPPGSLPYVFTSIAFGNDRFVAVDLYGKTAVSEDGIKWTLNGWTQNSPQSLNSIAFGGGYFVAVGSGSSSRRSGAILTSTNGSVWVRRTAPIDDDLRRVIFGDGCFLTIGSQGYTMRSSDLGVPLVINYFDPTTSIIYLSAARETSGTFLIETSADLRSWRSTTNLLIPESGVVQLPAGDQHAFYRARPANAAQENVMKPSH